MTPTVKLPDLTDKRGERSARRAIVGMSLAFGVALVGVSFLVTWLRRAPLMSLLSGVGPPSLLWGAGMGALCGVVAVVTVDLAPALRAFRRLVADAYDGVRPRVWDSAIIAASAGVGEELLFRGALQPIVGLWPAAILFVVFHGVVRIKSWARAAFAMFLLAAGVGLGYLAESQGVAASICGHVVYDFAVLLGIGWRFESWLQRNE